MQSLVQKIFITNVQGIVGHLISPEETKVKNPAILFIHGWVSNQTKSIDTAKELAQLGYISLTIDLRGHGESGGEFKKLTRADHLADVVAAYDFLLSQKGVDPEKISVVGSSYGGYLAALLAEERPVRSLVLRVPANYKDEGFDEPTYEIRKVPDLQKYRDTEMTPQENKALHAASIFNGNAYIIESENDEVIPHQTIENYKNAFKNANSIKHTLMHEADHRLNEAQWQEFNQLLKEYFSDTPHTSSI